MIPSFYAVGHQLANLAKYGDERAYLIARGAIVPEEVREERDRPCLRLRPGERAKFEREARNVS